MTKFRLPAAMSMGIACTLGSVFVVGACLALPARAQEMPDHDSDVMELADVDVLEVALQPTEIAEGPGGPDGPGGHHFPLSDDQLEKINSLKLQLMQSTAHQKADLKVLEAQLRDQATRPNPDRGQINSLLDKINALKGQLAAAKMNCRLDGMAVLTPEQREKFRHMYLVHQLMSSFGHHGRMGHGGMGGRRNMFFNCPVGPGGFGGPGGPGGPGGHHHWEHHDHHASGNVPTPASEG